MTAPSSSVFAALDAQLSARDLAAINAIVAATPPLTPDQQATLVALFAPTRRAEQRKPAA